MGIKKPGILESQTHPPNADGDFYRLIAKHLGNLLDSKIVELGSGQYP